MALQRLVLFVHLLGAVVLLASSLYGPLTRAAIRCADSLAALRSWLGFARDCARANPLAALVVLLTGVYLGRGRWSEGWLVVSLVVFMADTVIAVAVVEATGKRLGKLAATAGEGPVGEAIDRLRSSLAWDLGADALLASDVAVLYLMLQQPGLGASVAAVVLANAAALAYRLLRRRRAPVPALRGA
jgi:hypothetical protein